MNEVSYRIRLKKKYLGIICIDCIKLLLSHPSQASQYLRNKLVRRLLKENLKKKPKPKNLK